MKSLSKPRIPMSQPSSPDESGLFPIPTRRAARTTDSDAETLPAPASAHDAETIRAPGGASTRPATARSHGSSDVQIPPLPSIPFNLKLRSSRNRWRADVMVEWVKLNARDPRRE